MNYWIFRAYLFIRQSKFTTLKLIPFFFHIRWLSSRWHITTKTEYSINLWLNMRKLDKSILLCLKTNLHSVKSERKKEAQMIYNEQENSGFNLTQSILNSFVIESHSLRGAFRLFYFKLSCKARQSFSSIPKKCSSHWVLNTVLLQLSDTALPKCSPGLFHYHWSPGGFSSGLFSYAKTFKCFNALPSSLLPGLNTSSTFNYYSYDAD